MTCVIRAVAFANGIPCPHAGEWIEAFDHDAHDGEGFGVFTDRIEYARRFADGAEALAFWNRQSQVRPLRPDGEPNKPLTALTIVIETLV